MWWYGVKSGWVGRECTTVAGQLSGGTDVTKVAMQHGGWQGYAKRKRPKASHPKGRGTTRTPRTGSGILKSQPFESGDKAVPQQDCLPGTVTANNVLGVLRSCRSCYSELPVCQHLRPPAHVTSPALYRCPCPYLGQRLR